jgi:hypothetical protein
LSCDVANGYNLHGDATLSCTKGTLSGTQSCVIDYTWTPTVWSACSKKCGTGSRTRSFTCDGSDRTVRNLESLCTAQGEQKPTSTSQECNTQACDLTAIATAPAAAVVSPAYNSNTLSYVVDATATTSITFTFTKTSAASTISVFNHLESTSWSTLSSNTYVLNRVGASTVQTIYFLDSFDNTQSPPLFSPFHPRFIVTIHLCFVLLFPSSPLFPSPPCLCLSLHSFLHLHIH